MSATGRSDARQPNDAYPTPAWAVKRLLERVKLPHGNWLDPCAGEGAVLQVAKNHLSGCIAWHGVEIRPECKFPLRNLGMYPVIGDFLEERTRQAVLRQTPRGRFATVITNPPYSLARQFVEACLPIADVVVMLLRVGFLESEERADFVHLWTPNVYILPNRPSFVGKSTDATTYAWMLWRGGKSRSAGRIEILDTTPLAERKRR